MAGAEHLQGWRTVGRAARAAPQAPPLGPLSTPPSPSTAPLCVCRHCALQAFREDPEGLAPNMALEVGGRVGACQGGRGRMHGSRPGAAASSWDGTRRLRRLLRSLPPRAGAHPPAPGPPPRPSAPTPSIPPPLTDLPLPHSLGAGAAPRGPGGCARAGPGGALPAVQRKGGMRRVGG